MKRRSAGLSPQWVHHAKLRRWEKNPRRNARAIPKVAESIRRFGFVSPIVIWKGGGRLVAGDTRLQAFRSILDVEPKFIAKGAPGVGMVRVVFHEFESEKEANAYGIADNRLGEIAEWDPQLLHEVLLPFSAADIVVLGYDDSEASALMLLREPDFAPSLEDEQPRLDHRKPVTCPECDHEFIPK